MRLRLSIGVLVMGLAAACGCHEGRSAKMDALLGKPAPAVELTDLEGRPVALSQFRGSPVVVAFFAYG